MTTSDRVLLGVITTLSALTFINTVIVLVFVFVGLNGMF